MNMKDAADRLGQIIRKLGGGTSIPDQRELESLRDDMLAAAGDAHPKAQPRKRRATATPRTVKPLKAEPVAKAKAPTAKKGRGK